MKCKHFTLEELVEHHAKLKLQMNELKAKLKEAYKLAKPIAKTASKLYDACSKDMYIIVDDIIRQPVSSSVYEIIRDLESWRSIDVDLRF